jgi:hypothetical protein
LVTLHSDHCTDAVNVGPSAVKISEVSAPGEFGFALRGGDCFQILARFHRKYLSKRNIPAQNNAAAMQTQKPMRRVVI